MNEIALIDLISIFASFSGIIILTGIYKNKIEKDIKLLIIGLLSLNFLYCTFLFIEWNGITDKLDPYEDLIGALIPMMWAFLFYAFIQKSNKLDLAASEKQLDMALKGTRAGLWDWYIQTGKVVLNEQWAEILGYKLVELEPVSIDTRINYTHPDDFIKTYELLQKHFNGETAFYECESRMKHKNGHWIWIMDRGMVIERDENGKPVRMIGTYIEITEQKQAQIKLKEQIDENIAINKKYIAQNKELTNSIERIKLINQELIQAKVKAEESDQLKSAFLANISHEIRTPMNGILGFAELLEDPNLDKEKQQEFIKVIQRSGYKMLNIINDLIDISKIEAGQIDLKNENTNIKKLLNDLYLFFKPEADKKGLHLSYSINITDKENYIYTDKTKLNQILSNLINNSLKYTQKGKIEFGCSLKGRSIEFYVKDTGIGIPPDLQEKIFERFRQAELNSTLSEEGCGLGLTISKAFVEKMKGKIWVQSNPEKGSVFFFNIPFNPSEPKKLYQNKNLDQTNEFYKDFTILVAEDDNISFKFLNEVLSKNKIKVIRAHNGKEAINICKEHPEITLVLMDIKMPDINGFEAIKQIKQFKPELPVITQTAFAMSTDQEKILKTGSDGYLAKPVKRDELLMMIKKYNSLASS